MARKETNFKQTDIGLIPHDWEVVTIGNGFKFFANNTLSRSQLASKGSVLNVHYGDVHVRFSEVLDLEKSTLPFINASIIRNVKPYLIDGDIVMADTAEDEAVGKACEVINIRERKVEAGLHTFALRPIEKYAPRFLGYFINSKIFHDQLLPLLQGTKVYSITKSDLKGVSVVTPSPNEQERIAEVLSHFDEHIDNLVALLEKRKQVKAATMHALLSGSTRLPGFTAPWQDKFLGDIAIIIMGLSPSSKFYNTEKRGLPLIQGNADIGVDRKQLVRVYTTEITNTCDVGDIIFSVRAPVGSVGIANYKSCIGRGVCSIKYQNAFLYHLLIKLEKSWSQLAQGSTFDSITRSQLEEKRLYIPTSLVEQSTIATVLSNMDRGIEALEQEIKKYRQMKEGAMEELLTGKTRLL